MTLGGYICVRNGYANDYCWELAAQSLLPVVDELILCDSDSTDGTREAMERWADKEPKIKVVNYPWPNPKGDGQWWVKWLNYARQHLTTDYQITLDGDEVLSNHPDCHAAIREAITAGKNEARTFNRLNFWKNASSLIPEGHCCGKWVVRLGRTEWWMPSDEGHSKGELPIIDEAQRDPRLEIFHLGFLRRTEAMYRKARVVLGAFFNEFDKRLEPLEAAQRPIWEVENCEWTNSLMPWDGYMPEPVERWLSDRGHTTKHYLGMNELEAYKRVVVTHEKPRAGEPYNVLVVGDLGDIAYTLPILKQMGRVNLYVRDANFICKRIVHRLPLIEGILRSLPYVASVKAHEEEHVHWNAGDFRMCYKNANSLPLAAFRHYNIQKGLPRIVPDFRKPWIEGVTPDERTRGRIVINRTPRYHNPLFRWPDILAHYAGRTCFIGHEDEHAAFCHEFGPVPYLPTKDLAEAAQAIAGSDLFIGNQSSCYAVAEGMKHARVLEVCLYRPDVVVLKNDGSRHLCADGALDLPSCAGKEPLKLAGSISHVNYLKNPNQQPRTGWHLGNLHDVSYNALMRQVKKKNPTWTEKQAHKAIFDALAEREPSYFSGGTPNPELAMFREAMANAL